MLKQRRVIGRLLAARSGLWNRELEIEELWSSSKQHLLLRHC